MGVHMRCFRIFVAGALALAALAPPRAAAEIRPDRLQIFDQVWSEVRDRYYDPGFNGVDWAAVRARYRPRVDAVADESAFYDLLRSMLGELGDAHTRCADGGAGARPARESDGFGGSAAVRGRGAGRVFDVRPTARGASGRHGRMRVLAVTERRSASRWRARALRSARLRRRAPRSFFLSAPDRRTRERDASAQAGARRRHRLRGRTAAPCARRGSAFRGAPAALGTALRPVRRFRAPVARQLSAALAANLDATGLILDLRANPGGDGKEGCARSGRCSAGGRLSRGWRRARDGRPRRCSGWRDCRSS